MVEAISVEELAMAAVESCRVEVIWRVMYPISTITTKLTPKIKSWITLTLWAVALEKSSAANTASLVSSK